MIHKLCNTLSSDFATFYLDDGTFGGNREDIVKDQLMIEKAGTLDLQLNHKEEFMCPNQQPEEVFIYLPRFTHSEHDDATLLGSPLGVPRCVDKCSGEKVKLMGENPALSWCTRRVIESHVSIPI